jgi:transposase-like protein
MALNWDKSIVMSPHARYTVADFHSDFPDDARCLDYLASERYPDGMYCPKCNRVTKHHRERARPSYSCQFCGHREHPMRGTIFEKSGVPLRLWFYALFLMAGTEGEISARRLGRELGVTYVTARRMYRRILSLFADEREPVDVASEGAIDQAPWRSFRENRSNGGSRTLGVFTSVRLPLGSETETMNSRDAFSFENTPWSGDSAPRGLAHTNPYSVGEALYPTVARFWRLLERGVCSSWSSEPSSDQPVRMQGVIVS